MYVTLCGEWKKSITTGFVLQESSTRTDLRFCCHAFGYAIWRGGAGQGGAARQELAPLFSSESDSERKKERERGWGEMERGGEIRC